MDALLLASSSQIRRRLHDALQAAAHTPDCHEDLDAAQRAYARHGHSMVFVECPLDHDASTSLFDHDRSVVTAILPSRSTRDGLCDARALQADFILDHLDSPVLDVRLELIERQAQAKRPDEEPPATAPELQAAEHSSETFHTLTEALDTINDAALIADAQQSDLPMVYCNPAFEEMTGYAADEALGRNCRFLQGPDTNPEARKRIRTALENRRSCTTVLKNYRKDGTPFWNEITISPIRDPSGTVTHFLGILHDITEQREREHQIEQNQQYLRRIVDSLPQLIFLKDESGTYLLANETTAEVYGTTPDELEGATDAEFAAAEEGRDFRIDDREVIASNEPKEFIETITDADGQERILKTELLPFRSLHRDERLLLCIATDITEQIRTENALRQERDLLDSIMSTSVAAIAVIDAGGQIVFANDRAEDLLDLEPTPNENQYHLCTWRLTALDGAPLSAEEHPFQRVMQTGEPVFDVECAIEWPDGRRRLLSINAAPLMNDTGEIERVVTSIDDITERKAAEQALQASEERWRRLVRHHPEPILITTNAEIQYINAAGARTFGAEDPDDIVGRTIFEFTNPAIHDILHERIATLESGTRTEPLEHRLHRLDGEERIVQAFSVPITYEGEPSAQTVVRDVTEQKEAERTLKIREKQQVAVAELGLYALEESDLDTFMDEVARRLADTLDVAFCSILELLPDGEFLRLKSGVGWPEERLEQTSLHVQDDPLLHQTLTSDEPVVIDAYDDFDGTNLPHHEPVESGVSVVIRGRNQPYGILNAFATEPRAFTSDDVNFLQTIAILIRDAVERRRSEMELLLSEKRYRSVVEQQTELICRFAPDGTITFVNHAFRSFVGHPAEDLINQNFLELMPSSDHEAFRELMSSLTPDAPVQKREMRLYDAEGKVRWLRWAFRAFFQADGDVAEFQASGRDITERKQLEREILDVSARERRRIGQDLHDGLGSHLSGVAMLCRGVIRKIEAGERVDKSVMEEIVQLVHESISQVRKLARGLNPVRMEDEGLCSALQELVSSAQAHPGVNCSFSSDSDVPDPNSEVALHLYRIAQEALNNALKHASADHIHMHLGTKADTLVLTVDDDGVGIPSSRNDRDGMGLRVMNYRANTIGAKLRIRPRSNGGTRVQCTLPAEKIG